jgi:hypothetical protein
MKETLQILKTKELDARLLNEGYVVVPFLDSKQVKILSDFFYENHPQALPGFYATAHVTDIDFRKKMNQKIKEVFLDAIEAYFVNCEALGGSFVVKSNLQKERLHPHQDWNIVDESKYRSFNIWVPLVDLSEANGAIRVLPESHLWGLNYRGPNIPESNPDKIEHIWNEMQTLLMKAGEALIYDHRLYHASFPNQLDTLRLATVFGIKPKEADMLYYFGEGENIGVYKSSVDFFMEGNIQEGPSILEKIASIAVTQKELTPSTQSWWEKLLKFKIFLF